MFNPLKHMTVIKWMDRSHRTTNSVDMNRAEQLHGERGLIGYEASRVFRCGDVYCTRQQWCFTSRSNRTAMNIRVSLERNSASSKSDAVPVSTGPKCGAGHPRLQPSHLDDQMQRQLNSQSITEETNIEPRTYGAFRRFCLSRKPWNFRENFTEHKWYVTVRSAQISLR
jgi:hypothetical protein